MLDTIAGLPVHPLVVHATEVIVPAAAVAVVLAALWPAFRRWARFLPLGLALAAVVLVPLSTESGEALEHRVGESALVEKHAGLAEGMLPWVLVLALVAAALVWWHWTEQSAPSPRGPRALGVALIIVAVVVGGGTMTQAVLVGHSGAKAVWSEDVPSDSSVPADDD